MTRYDTQSGVCLYHDDPIPGQAIGSMAHDGATDTLLAATTFEADCQSAPPSSTQCYFALIRADDLKVINLVQAPGGTKWARVIGPLRDGGYLAQVAMKGADAGSYWFALAARDFRVPDLAEMAPYPAGLRNIKAAGAPGLFVVLTDNNELQLWNWEAGGSVRTLYAAQDEIGNYFVDGDSVLLGRQDDVIVLEGCLASEPRPERPHC